MQLFRRQRVVDPVALTRELARARERSDLLSQATLGFLYCIKELSIDVDEIGAETLKRRVDELMGDIKTELEPSQLRQRCAERHDEILAFAEREKGYLGERESELRHIIELLSSGLSALGAENAQFHQGLQQRSSRLEQLSQLDDLRRVRQELKVEVHQLRETVRDKQQKDSARVEKLSREVEVLQLDVAHAKEEALRDPLTGAANRAAFDRTLRGLIERSALGEDRFSLLLADVDHFKSFNDTYGHLVGDRVLVGLVQTLRGLVRSGDLVSRYGGEEFAILLPGAPLQPAHKKAKLICKMQSSKQYRTEDEQIVEFTVSMGVASYRVGDTSESLVARADQALYQAKKRGRNRAFKEV